jgi:hypothetical protein
MAEKEKPNLKVLVPILFKGEHLEAGTVIAKSDFAVKGDWQNLAFAFDTPRLAETDDEVGKPKAAKAKAAATPATLPGQS